MFLENKHCKGSNRGLGWVGVVVSKLLWVLRGLEVHEPCRGFGGILPREIFKKIYT